ncbi:MAG: hypothetical protein PF436_07550 [Prolixibacteraceae bacterium]|nr:hypothetical protein [Prolixibacteraceae bacterium]
MKNLFTIAVLLLMVAFSSKTFAQAFVEGIPMAPSEGQSVNYILNGMTNGDTYVFGVNQTEGEYVNGSGEGGLWTISSGSTVSNEQGSATIQWLEGSASTNFFVWIQITDAEGCHTFRHLPVAPVEATPVENPYTVNYGILAMGTGDDNGIENASEGTEVEACPAFFGTDWSFETLDDQSTHDGSSFIYYRITRSAETTTGDPVAVDAWSITPSIETGSVTATDWGYASASGQTFATFSPGTAITGISGDVIYIRAQVENTDASNQTLAVTIDGTGDDEETTLDQTKTHVAPAASLTVTPVPSVGDFSLSE